MRPLARLRSFWRDVAHRAAVERDLDDELRAYVELLAAEQERNGLTASDARRAALAEIGSVERVKEDVRAVRVDRWLATALPDVRHALRTLRRAPVFALVAVATLALGVGGTAGVFAVYDAALLRPPAGVREPRRVVSLLRKGPDGASRNFGFPDYADYRDQARSLAGLAAHRMAAVSVRGAADQPAERARGDVVTGGYFAVLGTTAALGRLLGPADDRTGAPAAAVLAHDFWRRAWGSDPRAVGATVWLDGRPFVVVGVAQRGFTGSEAGEPADLWVPMAAHTIVIPTLSADVLADRSAGWLSLVGRLRDGVSPQAAEVELRGIARRLASAYPATNADRSVRVLRDVGSYPDDRAELGSVLGMLGGAVSLLLLTTCVNVAGLLLVRATARRREVATRLALGATRVRLVRLLVAEGLLLAGLAAGPAVFVAWLVARAATALQPAASLLHAVDARPDARVIGVALLVATVAGTLAALVPATRLSSARPADVLKATSPRAGGGSPRLQRSLVALQVAVSVVLLAAAGLTVSAVRRALGADPGFEPAHVALASVDLGMQGYDRARGAAFYRAALARLAALPGVESASLAKTMPPRDWSDRVSIFMPGEEPPAGALRGRESELGLRVHLNHVGPRFLATLGIPLRAGRDFTLRDDERAPGVAIVSARLARHLWPGESPIGKRIAWPDPDGAPRAPLTVVGEAADGRYLSLTEAPPLLLYVPVLQEYDGRAALAVRTAGDPARAAADMARTLREIDPGLPVFGVESMRRHMEGSLWRQRTASTWVLAFGALAVVLSALGLYGVAAQSVEQRARDLSVHLALGAAPGAVARRVLREGLVLTARGLALGLPGAAAAAIVVRATVDGVGGSSAAHLAGAALAVTAATLAACAAPAWRAARANPADALRGE